MHGAVLGWGAAGKAPSVATCQLNPTNETSTCSLPNEVGWEHLQLGQLHVCLSVVCILRKTSKGCRVLIGVACAVQKFIVQPLGLSLNC